MTSLLHFVDRVGGAKQMAAEPRLQTRAVLCEGTPTSSRPWSSRISASSRFRSSSDISEESRNSSMRLLRTKRRPRSRISHWRLVRSRCNGSLMKSSTDGERSAKAAGFPGVRRSLTSQILTRRNFDLKFLSRSFSGRLSNSVKGMPPVRPPRSLEMSAPVARGPSMQIQFREHEELATSY